MFRRFHKRRKARLVSSSDGSLDPAPSRRSPWLQSRVQGLVQSLHVQQRQWRSNQRGTNKWRQYVPAPLRRLKRLFSTNSEPDLLVDDDWDFGAGPGEPHGSGSEGGEVTAYSAERKVSGSLHHESEEDFQWTQSGTASKLQEPNKQYYVLTPESDAGSSGGDGMTQWRRSRSDADSDKAGVEPGAAVMASPQDNRGVSPDDHLETSLTGVQVVQENALSDINIPSSLCDIPEQKVVPYLLLTSPEVVKESRQITGSSVASTASSNHVPVARVLPPSIVLSESVMHPSIVLQQPDQTSSGEDARSRSDPGQLHLKLHAAEMVPSRKSPVTVQEWVDSLPLSVNRGEEERDDPVLDEADEHLDLGLGAEGRLETSIAGLLFGGWPEVIVDSPQHAEKALRTVEKGERREGLVREASVQSDVTSHTDSHCSSMESYLESRRANPEEVLLGLGFGGPRRNVDSDVSRIPQRFLNPSKVKGVAIDDFLRHQQDLAETFESGFSGYRGLIGGGSSNTLKLERSNSRAMSPRQSFSPLSPLFVENLANIPARFLPQLHHTSPRRLLNIPGKESPIKRTHSIYSRSGPSHTPSVIVSKIMEKLRTQREYSSQGSVVSQAPSTTATPSLPPQPTTETGNINNKFSHIARKVMKRTNVTSALSVLSPANREFLDSQGSKSPEVPRKRMIIGPRSFTFDCDGDLIEVESSSSSPPSTAGLPQTKPITNVRKPLIHKDSVLSTVTSMSLTSIDSDSDTDDRSSGYSPTRRPLPEISSNSEHPSRTALPLVSNVSKPVNSSFFHLPLNKRASSTSISSWESEAVSPLLPQSSEKSPSKYLNKAKSWDEDKFKEQKSQPNFYVSPDNSAFHPLRYESIDETVEMRADSMEMSPKENVLPDTEASNFPFFNSPSVEGQSEGKPSVVSGIEVGTEAKEYVPRGLVTDAHEVLSDLNTLPVSFETDTPSTVMSDPFSLCSPAPPTCLMHDQVCVLHRNTQFRRGSLMRQKNIMEEEPTDSVTVNSAKQQNNNDDVSVKDNCHHIHDSESDTTEAKNNSNGELINRDIDSLPVDKSYHLQVFNDPRGDSFEMEEIYTLEEERAPSQLLRTRSDSSGFLDGDAPDLFQEMAALHNTEQDFDSLVDPDTHIGPVSLAQDAIGTNSVLERGFITDKEDESTLSLSLGNNITKENLAHFDVINGLENGYINGLHVQRNDLECKITSASQNKVLRNDSVCLDEKINKTIKKNFKSANVRVKSSEGEQIVWPSVEAWGQDRYAKRLSLPVVCIHDETGNLHCRRSISLHSVNSDDSCPDSSPKIRKARSAPHSLAHSVFDGSSNMQTCNSYSNMFSFCSDESVIHIEPRRTSNFSNKLSLSSSSQTTIEFCGGSVNYAMRQSSSLNNLLHSSHYMESHSLNHAKNNDRRASALKPKLMNRSTKEIQELMKELTERGLEVGDSHIACNSDTQWAQLQTSTLRLAVEAYGRQLGSSTEVHTEEALECTEAQTEMLVVQEIRSHIVSELRRIADLLEEEPAEKLASITGQMTALLREQTRLCQQLAGLNQETLPVQPTPHNCSQEQIVGVIREENRHLEELVESNSRELAEIRQMLKQILNTRDA